MEGQSTLTCTLQVEAEAVGPSYWKVQYLRAARSLFTLASGPGSMPGDGAECSGREGYAAAVKLLQQKRQTKDELEQEDCAEDTSPWWAKRMSVRESMELSRDGRDGAVSVRVALLGDTDRLLETLDVRASLSSCLFLCAACNFILSPRSCIGANISHRRRTCTPRCQARCVLYPYAVTAFCCDKRSSVAT